MEMSPLDENSFDRAEARLGLMQDLCGKKCMRSYDEIDREELKNALVENVSPKRSEMRVYAYSDRARWTPAVTDLLERIAKSCLQTGVKVRITAKKSRNRDLSRTNYAIRTILLGHELAGCDKQIPISQSTKNRVVALVQANAEATAIVDALWEGFGDLRATARWALRTDPGRQVVALLRTQAKKPVDGIALIRKKIAEYVATSANERDGKRKAADLLKAQVENAQAAYLAEHIERIVEHNAAWFATYGVSISAIQSIDLSALRLPRLHGLLANYPENLLVNYTSDRRLEKAASDFGDIQHACYIPYVDVFRADSFAAGIFKEHAASVHTHISTSLYALPNEIRTIATQREEEMRSDTNQFSE